MTDTTSSLFQRGGQRSILSSIAVRLAGVWVLIGALAKLFMGTPKDLPGLVRD